MTGYSSSSTVVNMETGRQHYIHGVIVRFERPGAIVPATRYIEQFTGWRLRPSSRRSPETTSFAIGPLARIGAHRKYQLSATENSIRPSPPGPPNGQDPRCTTLWAIAPVIHAIRSHVT